MSYQQLDLEKGINYYINICVLLICSGGLNAKPPSHMLETSVGKAAGSAVAQRSAIKLDFQPKQNERCQPNVYY